MRRTALALLPPSKWAPLTLVLLFCGALVAPAAADPIDLDDDPATLHIGTGAGTACAQGCGGDPNVIGSGVLSIFQNQGGGPDLLSPLLLILGVPNTTGLGSAPVIGSVTEYDPYPGTLVGAVGSFSLGGAAAYGWSGAGFAGNWTPASDQIYEFLNFEPPNTNSSNNATNWFGVAPVGTTFFGIYVYRINATLGAKGLFDVDWVGDLPTGTIAIAYGCSSVAGSGRCASGADVYTTPFTEAGRVGNGQVPEPGAWLLMLIGVVTAAGFERRVRNCRHGGTL